MKVQLVFQGGGARFASLLAVAEAVQELQGQGKIVVTRVAGASAGALAAAIVGHGTVKASDVRLALERRGDQFFKEAFPESSLLGHLYRLYKKRALYSLDVLRPLLGEFFSAGHLLSEQKVPTLVSVTSLTRDGQQVLQGETNLHEAVLRSASIPFVFANLADLEKRQYSIDGGVLENLPAKELLDKEAQYGPVLGISFTRESKPGAPKSYKEYIGRLINIIVDHGVERSVLEIGADNVLRVQSPLDTLDFETICSVGLETKGYSGIKLQASSWIHDRLQYLASAPSDNRRAEHRLQQLHTRIDDVYRAYAARNPVDVVRAGLVVVGSSLTVGGARYDEAYHITQIQTGDQPLVMFMVGIGQTSVAQAIVATDRNGKEWSHVVIPSVHQADPSIRTTVLFCDPPVPPGTLLEVRRVEHVMGALSGLSQTPCRAERISNRNRRESSIAHMDLVIAIPSQMRPRVEPVQGSTTQFGTIDSAVLKKEYGFAARPSLDLHGWRAKDVDQVFFGLNVVV